MLNLFSSFFRVVNQRPPSNTVIMDASYKLNITVVICVQSNAALRRLQTGAPPMSLETGLGVLVKTESVQHQLLACVFRSGLRRLRHVVMLDVILWNRPVVADFDGGLAVECPFLGASVVWDALLDNPALVKCEAFEVNRTQLRVQQLRFECRDWWLRFIWNCTMKACGFV